jgi:integrase
MSKRDYGSGGMRKRGKKWQVTYRLPADPVTGKRGRKTFTGTTKKEVLAARDAFKHRVEHGLDVAGAQSTLAQYFEQWLTEHRGVSRRTLAGYQQTGRVFVAAIADVRLEDLRPSHIERALHVYLETGASNRTAAKHLTVLKQALKHAVRLQLIPSNPADAVAKPRAENHEMHVADAETLQRLFDACDDEDLRRLIFVAVDTGLRAGELLALRWSDLNVERSMVQIQRARNGYEESGFAEPKTKASRRTVVVSSTSSELLKFQRVAQNERRLAMGAAWADGGLIFPREDGQPEHTWRLSRRWKQVCKLAGVVELRFHDLRHTSATIALENGVHPKVVQERLGHSTISTTMDTYSHVLPTMQAEAAERIGDALSVLNVTASTSEAS